ncbi:hypothetical protein BDB01DRAFT_901151 [Pilobolus umbonatus]|nr:hypothetical protein BDB01DRAFT_901151 [Pilobolus umbonatus]
MSTVKAENIFVYCCRNDNYIDLFSLSLPSFNYLAHPCISSNGSTLTQLWYQSYKLLVVVLMILTDRSFLSPNNMFIYVLNLTETTSHGINECVPVL